MLINLSNATIAVTEKTLLSDVDFHVSEGEFVSAQARALC